MEGAEILYFRLHVQLPIMVLSLRFTCKGKHWRKVLHMLFPNVEEDARGKYEGQRRRRKGKGQTMIIPGDEKD